MQIDKIILIIKYKPGAVILQNTLVSHSDQSMVWQKTRITDQWNWTKSPEKLNTCNEQAKKGLGRYIRGSRVFSMIGLGK